MLQHYCVSMFTHMSSKSEGLAGLEAHRLLMDKTMHHLNNQCTSQRSGAGLCLSTLYAWTIIDLQWFACLLTPNRFQIISDMFEILMKSWHLYFREANALAAEAREELEDPKNPIVQQFFSTKEGPKMSFLQLFLGKAPLFPLVFCRDLKKFYCSEKGGAVWVEGIRPLKMDGSASDGIFWGVLGAF